MASDNTDGLATEAAELAAGVSAMAILFLLYQEYSFA
jgi:hypothetical protein